MKTKIIIAIVIVVLLLIAVSCWCFLKGKTPSGTKPENTSTSQGTKNVNTDENGDVIVDANNISDVYDNPQEYSDNMYDIPTDKIVVENNEIRVEKATISEINDNLTLVYLDIVNQMGEPLSKDARLDIELLNESGDSLGIIGAVIEEDEDLRTGVGTTIRTQFLDRIVGINSIKVTVVEPN